jgi:hypothetical protein
VLSAEPIQSLDAVSTGQGKISSEVTYVNRKALIDALKQVEGARELIRKLLKQ